MCKYTRVQLGDTEDGQKEKRGKHLQGCVVCECKQEEKEEYSNID